MESVISKAKKEWELRSIFSEDNVKEYVISDDDAQKLAEELVLTTCHAPLTVMSHMEEVRHRYDDIISGGMRLFSMPVRVAQEQ